MRVRTAGFRALALAAHGIIDSMLLHVQLLEQRVRERTADLEVALEDRRLLLSRLVSVQEEERQQIANDVHDDSVQVMAAAQMQLNVLGRTLSDPDQLSSVEGSATPYVSPSVDSESSSSSFDHPCSTRGFGCCAQDVLEQNLAEAGWTYELVDHLREEPTEETRTVLYRIAQEVLVNVRKHARAQKVHVLLENGEGSGLHVVIRDDGIGFRPEDFVVSVPGHLGWPQSRIESRC